MKKSKNIVLASLIIVMFVSTFALQNSINVEAKSFTKTGGYYTSLCKKDDKQEKYDSYAKKLVFKSNEMILHGTMHYTKPGDVYSSKIYKKAKRTYVISSKCKYYKQSFKNGGTGKKKEISQKTLKELALPLDSGSYSGRTLAWTIKDGKVVELIYREY